LTVFGPQFQTHALIEQARLSDLAAVNKDIQDGAVSHVHVLGLHLDLAMSARI
jgi:hypothetical protein